MMTYLERRGAMYRFRRVVPPELRAFFPTSSGKPRTEFSFSLGTKDRREAERLCRIKSVEIDAKLEDARVRLSRGASGAPLSPRTPATAMSASELAEMELRSAANLEADFEWLAREGERQGLLKMLKSENGNGMRALRDLVDENLFAPEHEQRLRQQEIEKSWSEGEAAVARQFGIRDGVSASPARNLRGGRRDLCDEHGLTFRELYRTLELPGSHPLKDLHAKLDRAVRAAYGMTKKGSGLPFILRLNDEVASAEAKGVKVQGPGIPAGLPNTIKVKSSDCISEP